MPVKRPGYFELMSEKIERWRRDDTARVEALAAVRQLNATLSASGAVWTWPTIGAALTAEHPWLIVACDSCGLMLDLDLRMKPRDPNASVRSALEDVRCPRCNGHGRPRIMALARHPSV